MCIIAHENPIPTSTVVVPLSVLPITNINNKAQFNGTDYVLTAIYLYT